MTWILVGYIVKARKLESGWVSSWPNPDGEGMSSSEPVEELCSVSNCIVKGFWNDKEQFGLYSTPELAWAAVPFKNETDYALYAYNLWTVQFEEGIETPIELWWDIESEPLTESFQRLGWDVVEGGNGKSFGCSPMSCNRGCLMVHSPDMNRYCLVSSYAKALELACRFSIDKPEPGPYCVVEVWREGQAPEQQAVGNG